MALSSEALQTSLSSDGLIFLDPATETICISNEKDIERVISLWCSAAEECTLSHDACTSQWETEIVKVSGELVRRKALAGIFSVEG